MINSALQEGIYVRVIGESGRTLFQRKGELLGFTNISVTIRNGNTIYICKPDGSTQSTRRYQGGKTSYDEQIEIEENRSGTNWTKGTFILYLLFGWLIKIGAGYRLYKLLGGSHGQLTVGETTREFTKRTWKDVGIWLMSVIFWIICIVGGLLAHHQFKTWMGQNDSPSIETSTISDQ